MTPTARPSPLSLELALVVGVPLLTVVAGAFMVALSLSHGFTAVATPPAGSAAAVAPHGS